MHASLFIQRDPDGKAGVRAEKDGYKAAYFTFCLCDMDGSDNRQTVFERTVNWLREGGETPAGIPLYAAGFADTRLTSAGGTLEMVAYTNPAYDIESLDIYYGGFPLGITLSETADCFYSVDIGMGPVPAASYTLGLVATLANGDQVIAWPYLPVGSPNDWKLIPSPPATERGVSRSAADGPSVYAAGFCATNITEEDGGIVHVVAKVEDPDGLEDIQSVTWLAYYLGLQTPFEMLDDGNSGDFAAGDGIYGFVGDSFIFENGLLASEIRVEDSSGNIGKWPAVEVAQ